LITFKEVVFVERINIENDREIFRKQFQSVHPLFFKQQKAKYLNVTPQAVDKSRNRLRKKLNIDASVNLYEFLMEVG
jgi:hypothetical protein